MIRILPLFVLAFTVSLSGQSGRVAAPASPDPMTAGVSERTVKQMFEEANGYVRAKAAEFDKGKIAFTGTLFDRTKLEQRQLAAKYAIVATGRTNLAGEDLYYLGMLHWIAENLDGTVESLQRFTASEGTLADRSQTARSVVTVALAKQGKVDDAEKALADYLAKDPKKLTERARMEGELAKAYQARKEYAKMAPHAEQDYAAAKALLADAASIARGLDEILDAGMLVFEAYRDLGDRVKAEAALDDMRATAVRVQSPSFAYYATDQKIRYLIDTGRKPAALELHSAAIASAPKDFPVKALQDDLLKRFRPRATHYKVLGGPAPELPSVDRWFPGRPQSFADLKGKVVLLDFWATWCGPCFEAFPDLIEWQEQFKGQGLVILGVTRYYDPPQGTLAEKEKEIESLKAFRTKWKLPYDFVVASDQSIQMLYGGMALPTAAIIDRKGVVRYLETGTSRARIEQMREMILKLLAEK